MLPAVFLDRDGVINENRDDYVRDWTEVRFIPGALEALARLSSLPFSIVLITNQSAIGRGILTLDQVEAIHRRLVMEIQTHGGRMDAVYYCPHHPDVGCECRKPKPGLLYRAAQDLELDLARSCLIGDAVSDVEAALAAGCRPILVQTGRGREQQVLLKRRGFDHVPVVRDLAAAVTLIQAEQEIIPSSDPRR